MVMVVVHACANLYVQNSYKLRHSIDSLPSVAYEHVCNGRGYTCVQRFTVLCTSIT